MFFFFMALVVHQMIIPDNRSTAESTRLDMIAIEEDRPTATALATKRI